MLWRKVFFFFLAMLFPLIIIMDEDLYVKDGLILAMLRYGFIWAGGGFGVHGSHTICRRLFSIMVALSSLLFL